MDFQVVPAVITPTADGFAIAVKGSIHANTAWLEGELKKVAAANPKRVDLDLSDTHSISSQGLSVLIGFRSSVVKNGGALKIVAIQKQVFGTFMFAALINMFLLEPSAIVQGKK